MCKEGVTSSIAHYPKFNFSKVDRKKVVLLMFWICLNMREYLFFSVFTTIDAINILGKRLARRISFLGYLFSTLWTPIVSIRNCTSHLYQPTIQTRSFACWTVLTFLRGLTTSLVVGIRRSYHCVGIQLWLALKKTSLYIFSKYWIRNGGAI